MNFEIGHTLNKLSSSTGSSSQRVMNFITVFKDVATVYSPLQETKLYSGVLLQF